MGKGTFADLLCRHPQATIDHLSVGEVIRSSLRLNRWDDFPKKTTTAEREEIVRRVRDGELLSDEVVNSLVGKRIYSSLLSPDRILLLDGYPRSKPQAEFVLKLYSNNYNINYNNSYNKNYNNNSSNNNYINHNNNYNNNNTRMLAVHIDLDESVAVEKLLGRRTCAECGANFNISSVVRNGFDMPAIRPRCKRKGENNPCEGDPVSVSRDDDRPEVVVNRMREALRDQEEVLQVFRRSGMLRRLEVKKGVKDFNKLVDLLDDFL